MGKVIHKGIDASGQPYTMIKDRDGTRYVYPEGKSVWSGFNNELGMGGGLSTCRDCDTGKMEHCTTGKDHKMRCGNHHKLHMHIQDVML
tara:strand:+ start:516 stop:782 length:267 start_codon:yes stop_codon:yes gene_type:complete